MATKKAPAARTSQLARQADEGAWWKHPAVIGAGITGVLGLLTAIAAGVLGGSDGGAAEQSPDGVKGIEVALRADTGSFAARCPFTVVFIGQISAASGSGEVSYRFVHTDVMGGTETKEAVQTVSFAGGGSADVRYEWVPNIPVGEVFSTVAVQVISPASVRSSAVTVTGTCDASLPPGPSIPPPNPQPPSG